jgi:3'-phosphoadenosine 5'-phosphosulfate sulfotransferase (PAPS reductase)/FAD synthetase
VSQPRLVVPEQFRDDASVVFVCNISSGKDSDAAALALTEAGIPHRRVFADTGWEAAESYAHLNYLHEKLGPIDVVSAYAEPTCTPYMLPDISDGAMVRKIRERAGFPARLQRWCTKELKLHPLRAYCDEIEATGATVVTVTGIRADESEKRAAMAELEDDETWGGWMWRPILAWSVEDVLAIHHRYGIEVNPLYRRGHSRVGCYPCIMSNKTDIRLVAEYAPERIDLIRELEREWTLVRARRNEEEPGRYKYPDATFFQTMIGDRSTFHGAQFIDEIVAWSRTERGGRQLPMFPEPPDGGCFRWGLCDAPASEELVEGR